MSTFRILCLHLEYSQNCNKNKVEYKEFNNTTNGDYSQYTPYHGCYSTVGIESPDQTQGFQYTFANRYAELSDLILTENIDFYKIPT